MFFEAQLKGKTFYIDLNETDLYWKIGIQEQDKDWVFYEIKKSDYQPAERTTSFLFKGSSFLMDVVGDEDHFDVYTRGTYRSIHITTDEMKLQQSIKGQEVVSNRNELVTEIPGKILKVLVKPQDVVEPNTPLIIMEAMKMENEMRTEGMVRIAEILVKEGQSVDAGTVLVRFADH